MTNFENKEYAVFFGDTVKGFSNLDNALNEMYGLDQMNRELFGCDAEMPSCFPQLAIIINENGEGFDSDSNNWITLEMLDVGSSILTIDALAITNPVESTLIQDFAAFHSYKFQDFRLSAKEQ